jgi:hypothetical protein
VTAFLNTIAPIVHADTVTDDEVMVRVTWGTHTYTHGLHSRFAYLCCVDQALNKELKSVAASIKEAFDQMPGHGMTYPSTKAPMATAARHLRPAAKNLLTAAKSVNERPGTITLQLDARQLRRLGFCSRPVCA